MSGVGDLQEGEALGGPDEAGGLALHGPVGEGRPVEGGLAGPVQVARPHVTTDVVADVIYHTDPRNVHTSAGKMREEGRERVSVPSMPE